jgi:hypothetical protein
MKNMLTHVLLSSAGLYTEAASLSKGWIQLMLNIHQEMRIHHSP